MSKTRVIFYIVEIPVLNWSSLLRRWNSFIKRDRFFTSSKFVSQSREISRLYEVRFQNSRYFTSSKSVSQTREISLVNEIRIQNSSDFLHNRNSCRNLSNILRWRNLCPKRDRFLTSSEFVFQTRQTLEIRRVDKIHVQNSSNFLLEIRVPNLRNLLRRPNSCPKLDRFFTSSKFVSSAWVSSCVDEIRVPNARDFVPNQNSCPKVKRSLVSTRFVSKTRDFLHLQNSCPELSKLVKFLISAKFGSKTRVIFYIIEISVLNFSDLLRLWDLCPKLERFFTSLASVKFVSQTREIFYVYPGNLC